MRIEEPRASNTRIFESSPGTQYDLIVFAETKIPKTVVANHAHHHTFNKNKEYYWSVSNNSLMYYLGIVDVFSNTGTQGNDNYISPCGYIPLYSSKSGIYIMTTLRYIEESDCYRVMLCADPTFNDARLTGNSTDLYELLIPNSIYTYNTTTNDSIGGLLPVPDDSGTYLTNLEVVELDWSAKS